MTSMVLLMDHALLKSYLAKPWKPRKPRCKHIKYNETSHTYSSSYHHSEVHHDASIFEKVELYLQHAIHVVAEPQLYVRCVDSFKNFASVLKSLPSHLEDEIDSAIAKIKDISQHQHKVSLKHEFGRSYYCLDGLFQKTCQLPRQESRWLDLWVLRNSWHLARF